MSASMAASMDKAALLGALMGTPAEIIIALRTIRSKMDTLPQTEYVSFLESFFFKLRDVLFAQEVQFVSSEGNMVRNMTLEIFARLPQNGIMKDYVTELMSIAIKVLCDDNDRNALLAMKIVTELNRTFRSHLEAHVQPMLDFVTRVYQNMPTVIDKIFGGLAGGPGSVSMDVVSSSSSGAAGGNVEATAGNHLSRATESLLVLTECPPLVLLLFQLYPRSIVRNISFLMPVMMAMIKMSPPQPGRNEKTAASSYRDFFASQVKALSLVSQLVRPYIDIMRSFEGDIAVSILSVLRRCPDDSMSSRKDVLASARHFVATDCRMAFSPYLDEILDGKIFYGRHETLKSQSYVVLADLVSHMKESLSQSQLFGAVLLFCSTMNDHKLSTATQLTSIRVVLSLVEKIAQFKADNNSSIHPKAYELNIWILRCIVLKYKSLSRQIANKMDILAGVGAADKVVPKQETQFLFYHPSGENYIRDAKHAVKTLIWGMRNLITHVQNMPSPQDPFVLPFNASCRLYSQYFRWALQCCDVFCAPATSGEPSSTNFESSAEMKDVLEHFVTSLTSIRPDVFREMLSENIEFLCERALKENMFLYVISALLFNEKTTQHSMDIVMGYFVAKLPDLKYIYMNPTKKIDEEDARNPQTVKSSTTDNTGLGKPADAASDSESKEVNKMGQRSTILLRLFKFALSSVVNFPLNEKFLRSRLVVIVMECVRQANDSRASITYYYLLRAIFKTISSGKFEESYKEMATLIPFLMVGFDSLLRRTFNKVVQACFLELSILLPARFATLIPFLPNLLGFVSKSLRVKGDLPQLGLRTLEFWIENLNPAFLSSVVKGVPGLAQELLAGVALHLQPLPYMYGTLALRVFGKLGGHTQTLVKNLPCVYDSTVGSSSNDVNVLNLHLAHSSGMDVEGAKEFEFRVDKVILGACEILVATSESTLDTGEGGMYSSSTGPIDILKVASNSNVKIIPKVDGNIVKFVMDSETKEATTSDPKRFIKETKQVRDHFFSEQKITALRVATVGLRVFLKSPILRTAVSISNTDDVMESQTARAAFQQLQEIIYAILVSAIDPALSETSCVILSGLCLHMAALTGLHGSTMKVEGSEGTELLGLIAMNNVIIRATSHAIPQLHSIGLSLLRAWILSMEKIVGSSEMNVSRNHVLLHLVESSRSRCHDQSWYVRIGGIKILADLCALLPKGWLVGRDALVTESVFISLRNSTVDLICVSLKDVFDALKTLVDSICGDGLAVSKDLSLLLLRSLFSHSSLVRLAAKASVENICTARACSVASVFDSVNADVKSTLDNLSSDTLLHAESVGVLYGIAYLAKWELPAIADAATAQRALAFLVPLLSMNIEETIPTDFLFGKRNAVDDPCGFNNRFREENTLHLSTFPVDVPQALTLRLACVRCVTSLFSNDIFMQTAMNYGQFVSHSAQFVLKSFMVQWEELLNEAQHGLATLFKWYEKSGNNLPTEHVDNLMQNFILALSDPWNIDTAKLTGLKAFVQSALSEVIDYSQVGRRCIQILRSLLTKNPEDPSVASKPVVQQNIFTLLMGILNSLPRQALNGDIVSDICLIAHAFDSMHTQFPGVQSLKVSFMAATCTLFLRFPGETIRFFINPANLQKPSFSFDLLTRLLKSEMDEAKLLASCLASKDGIDLLFGDVLSQVDSDELIDGTPLVKRQKLPQTNWFEVSSEIGNGILLAGLLVAQTAQEQNDRLFHGLRRLWKEMVSCIFLRPDASFWGNLHVRDWLHSLTKSLVSFCKAGFCQSELLLELVHMLCLEKSDALELIYLSEFFVEDVPSLVSVDMLTELISMYVALVQDNTMSLTWKSHCLRHLILPVLHATFTNPTNASLVSAFEDHSLTQAIANLWSLNSNLDESGAIVDEDGGTVLPCAPILPSAVKLLEPALLSSSFLRGFSMSSKEASMWDVSMKIEFLKATALIMSHSTGDIARAIFRRFLRYPWELMNTEDLPSIRQWALVNLCHFAATFDPKNPKLISALFTQLLKTYQVEGKDLFTGLTYEVIPLIAIVEADELLKLMKLAKKLLQDESSSSHQHAHVLQIISRHPNVFYPFRSLLSSQMLYSISRLGLNPNCTSEIRQIAIGIVDVFVRWELTRQATTASDTSEHRQPTPTPSGDDGINAAFKLTPQMLSITVSFVVRLSLSKETSATQSKSCVELFKKLLTSFNTSNIKVSHFDKMLQGIVEIINTAISHAKNEQAAAAQKSSKQSAQKNQSGSSKNMPENSIMTALELLTYSIDFPPISVQMLNPNLNNLISVFQPAFATENTQLQEAFKAFVVRVMRSTLYTPTLEFYTSYFYRKLKEEMETQLRFGNQTTMLASQPSMLLTLRLIQELTQVYPIWVDNHGSSLVRLCQRFLIECVQRREKNNRAESGGAGDDDGNSSLCFQPTPSVSVMAEFVPPTSSAKSSANLPADQSAELALILQLLLRGIQSGFLEQFKQGIVHIILSIIEGSFGQVLSNIVAEFCLAEVMTPSSHLTLKDQSTIFAKLFSQHDKLVEGVAFSYNIRITALAERIGGTHSHKASKIGDGLLLGLMSPDRMVREKCHSEIFPKWGSDPLSRLLTFLASDIPFISHRYWPALLTALFLDNLSAELKTVDFGPEPRMLDVDANDTTSTNVYAKFNSILEELDSGCLDSDIKEIALLHTSAGDSIWKQYLHNLWNDLDAHKRTELTLAVMKNVVRNRAIRRSMGTPEIPGYSHTHPSKALLGAFLDLKPPPPFPVEFLGAVASESGVCYEVLNTIESIDESCGGNSKNQTVNAMLKLYGFFDDRDLTLAQVRSSCSRPETDLALSLETFGHIGKAQQMLVHLLSCENPDNDAVATKAFDLEQWQGRWIETAKELAQWDALSTYAKDVGNVELAMESSTYSCDWSVVKLLRESPAFASIQERGAVKSKLFDIILAVIELRNVEADRFCMQSVQLALTQWQGQPEINRGSLFHKNLLHNFQRIIELRESASMLEQTRNSPERPGDISQFFLNWRSRLPLTVFNDLGVEDDTSYKPVGIPGVLGWESLLTWRVYIRAHVSPSSYDPHRQQRPKIYADSPWDMHKWALTAQTQAYHGGRQSLSAMFSRDESVDAFTNIRTRTIRCLKHKEGVEGSLQIIQGVKLADFDPDKRAELLRLKAMCQARLSMPYEAHESFALSVQTSESSAKCWMSWGTFCYDAIHQPDMEMTKKTELAMYSLTCALKATEFDAAFGRVYLSRVICLIDAFDDKDQKLAHQFVVLSMRLPPWIFLHYVPSLVSCLQRSYGEVVKQLVVHVGKSYPQTVLYSLIALHDKVSRTSNNTVAERCSSAIASIDNSRAVVHIRRFGTELSNSVLSDGLYYLLHKLNAILKKFSSVSLFADTVSESDAVLLRCIASCDFAVALGADVWMRMKSDIGKCLQSSYGQSLRIVISCIKTAEDKRRSDSTWRSVTLADHDSALFSPQFCGLSQYRVEIPGQVSLINGDVNQSVLVQIVRLLPAGGFTRELRFRFLGSDGRTYSFLASLNDSSSSFSTANFKRAVDWSLQRNFESRRRDLLISELGEIVPLPSQVTLVRRSPSTKSFTEMYDHQRPDNLSDRGTLMLGYLDSLANSKGATLEINRFRAYESVARVVPSSYALSYIISTLPSPAALFNFKRSVASELGVQIAMQVLLCSAPVSPNDVHFSTNDKTVTIAAIPMLDITVESSHVTSINPSKVGPLQLRLTSPIVAVLSPAMIRGVSAVTLGCTLDAVVQNRDGVKAAMDLMLLEHFDSYQLEQSREALFMNIEKCVQRLIDDARSLAPSSHYAISFQKEQQDVSEIAEEMQVPPIDKMIQFLLANASEIENIAQGNLSYEPWL